MLHTIMPALYVALALGAGYFTFFMYRRADLYYNRHGWYTLAMVTQAAIAVTAVVAIAIDFFALTLLPAAIFLVVIYKVRSTTDKIIAEEAAKTKALYNDVK